MKVVFSILGLVILVGVLYGLAFFGVIPVQKMAAKNPALAKTLAKLHLASAKPKGTAKAAAAQPLTPQMQALQAQQQQIDTARAQLVKDQAAFEAEKQQAAPAATSGSTTTPAGTVDTGAKISAIYATMSPDDIAKIFAKMPDPVVIQNLMPLDEETAGKVLAAMPADRAARLSQQMMSKGAAPASSTPPAQP